MPLRHLVRFMLFGLFAVAIPVTAEPPAVWVHDEARPLTDRALLEGTLPPASTLTERSPSARPHQVDPFQTLVDVEFDDERTVGQAVGQLLAFAGYDFVIAGVGIDPHAETLFSLPLPTVHRRFEGVSLENAILALIGRGYLLVVDPVERVASVDVAPEVRQRRLLQSRVAERAQ